MGVLGDILTWMADTAVEILEATGYVGLFLLMVAESLVLPVPSEAVMPFAGYLVWTGRFSWTGAIVSSSLGSVVGSSLGYLMGQHGFGPLVRKYGKYVLVQEHHVEAAERFFQRRGALAIFVCRFIPGVRHVCSIPAGTARMKWRPFLIATAIGATIWNVILLAVGYALGDEYERIHEYKGVMDIVAIGLGVLLIAYLVYEWRKGRIRKRVKAAADEGARPPLPPPN